MKDNLKHFKSQTKGPDPRAHMGAQRTPQPQLNLKADDLKNLKCKCGSEVFDQGLNMKILPAVLSPTGKEEVTPVPTIFCKECNTPIEEILAMRDLGLDKE